MFVEQLVHGLGDQLIGLRAWHAGPLCNSAAAEALKFFTWAFEKGDAMAQDAGLPGDVAALVAPWRRVRL